ncbi:MFS general substrate transporter [Saitoella complicata NRRL Y-17804]|uniref:Major facilitator superfamily (MFS) profile domain-containing protein n=1 Tax=Saitoella complicata (strain BCRC 22490 / CBS 7301 / JCM 7358 / NBRC 10748 / NRRL Y-17804) TaxID=698492 RepID=A0A0E9NJF3_SAICN|nr:MFS general substrate transporter [Saitoella complicata NRRL Y-17804]ODQ50158.1 MFS general substrate transporter [Saitoella complicata NRRL Y-17804]GAO49928.1 hypothetical protein G7K_4064-t1 [Saitoella complicata NRRL Y-17804]
MSSRLRSLITSLRPSEERSLDPDFKLPHLPSLTIILLSNVLLQLSFYITIPSLSSFTRHLGGTNTFSGLCIGIPPLLAVALTYPVLRLGRGHYTFPLHLCCGSMLVGNILYGCAYRAHSLWMMFAGRLAFGGGFVFFMYQKRFVADGRYVGVRRRTTLSGSLVVGQGVGTILGPWLGGVLYKVGFGNEVFTGYTAQAWILAAMWLVFWFFAWRYFKEEDPSIVSTLSTTSLPPSSEPQTNDKEKEGAITDLTSAAPTEPLTPFTLSLRVKFPMALMSFYACMAFFVLSSWEAFIPVYAASAPQFLWSPLSSGNFMALGGLAAFPFLLLNVFAARRVQDRWILVGMSLFGIGGLAIFLSTHETGKVTYAPFFITWFMTVLAFNTLTSIPVSLLSKHLPPEWVTRTSIMVQMSMYTGRVTGAVWGGAGMKVGPVAELALEMGLVGLGVAGVVVLWGGLMAKKG